MDGLRWLLLLFGLLVIAGVYFYSRRERESESADSLESERREPRLTADSEPESESDFDMVPLTGERDFRENDGAGNAPAQSEPAAQTTTNVEQKIVTVRIVAKEQKAFAGDELILSLRGIGLRHGKFGIFHRYDGNDDSKTIFSAASLVEPGSFDLTNIKDQEIPGISLFLVLPGPIDSVEAFDMMLEAARALTNTLRGELLDESGSNMSIQRERYMREEIIQYQHNTLVS